MASSTPTRTRLSREDRMEQTLAVAHDLFAKRGYAAVTMDEVAAEVGVTKPLLYNYFGNKERLYVACMEQSGDALFATIGEAVGASASPGDALNDGLRAFFAFLDADRAAWTVLFDETLPQSGEVADRVADYRGRIVDLVAGSLIAQLPAKRRAAARIEVEALSAALLGAAEALARWWLRTEVVSAPEAAELLISTIEPGLRLRSQSPAESTRRSTKSRRPSPSNSTSPSSGPTRRSPAKSKRTESKGDRS